jgi:hypothetical protein
VATSGISGEPGGSSLNDTASEGAKAMWDTVETVSTPLCHDRPCGHCGHPAHTYLPCSETCACVPAGVARAA